MEDIAPELLEKIKKDFEKKLEKSETIKAFREKVKKKTATYKDANDFAIEAGELLTDAFQSNLSKEILPDGKMYYNIADRIIRERLEHNYDITAEAAVEVQKILNEKAGIGIKAIKPEMNEDRVRGIINIVSGGKYEDVAYILGEAVVTDTNIVDTIMTGISEKLPEFLNKGVEMVTKIANGILESLPQLITMAGEAIVSFVSGMQSMLPTIMQKGAELILNLVNGIITNLPQIASAAGSAIIQYVAAIGRNLPSVLQSGIEIIGKLAAGLIQAIPKLIAQIPTIITSIKNEFLSVDWGKIGLNIIKGIANGLANAAGALWDAVKSALGDFKDNILGFFGIHSPSRWGEYVGNMIDQGIANGISGDAKLVTDSANLVKKAAYDPLTTDLSYTTNIGKIGNENGRRGIEERLDALEEVLITIAGKKQEVTMLLDRRELGRALLEV